MQSTTNYSLNIVEGTDIVNPLTQFNPNFTDIDSIMKDNADASIDHATCIKTGTVHAVTRTNTGANVFRFTATGNWNTGDTMTVDGTLVSVYVSDGSAPSNGCFVINTEVLASIQGTRVTLYVNSGDASLISFDDSSVSYTANNVQSAIEAASTGAGTEYAAGISVNDKIDSIATLETLTSAVFTYDANAKYWYSNQTVATLFPNKTVISILITPSYPAVVANAFINNNGNICISGIVTTNGNVFDNQYTFALSLYVK